MTLLRAWIVAACLLTCTSSVDAAQHGLSLAEGRKFWSFQPLATAQPATLKDERRVLTSVDRFILAALESKNLSPAPVADRRTLIRRLYFDLIGLPPTPDELKSAMDDAGDDWYEKLVDKLLASPHFGERWGRHWLDVARFAESDGYESDADRPTAWHYRDFVIQAFNDDMPFDQFVRWQLAGDEYRPDDPQAQAATGFLAAATTLRASDGTKREMIENRYNELDDMVSTMGSALLGLTIGCARCHDHKYDPISFRDYYRLAAAFASTERRPVPPKPVPGQADKYKPDDVFGLPLHLVDGGATPVESHILARGDVDKPIEVASLGFLSVLTPADAPGSPDRWLKKDASPDAKTTYRRTALAEWMTDVDHGAGHLLARVIVNRLWQHHFGQGLVRTPGDFGMQGDRPTHPKLLDWLASELIRSGWRLKPIHRLMLTSAAYRQGTTLDADKASVDPDNRLLWRRRPMRLEAEVLRDSILAVSGELRLEMGGPSIKVAVQPEAMAGRNKDGLERPKEDGPNQWRRSVYLFTKRSLPDPMLTTFDTPLATASCSRRNVSTVPTQALALLNNPFVRRQANSFAKRCLDSAPHDAECQVERTYLLALSRRPTPAELQAAKRFLTDRIDEASMTDFCQVLFGTNEFTYVD